ncbi:hypothetical protein HRbin17_01551 [bacterium HR17]|uniref:Flippase-like domain-containing protein n=1 Tax=Candidatus Fervidibacter japonicus TaxID=2035412 RepID=A0A2H5XCX0_9BACT|nr:hypothetical protein HRbin17_01551 [bacterium HR17]
MLRNNEWLIKSVRVAITIGFTVLAVKAVRWDKMALAFQHASAGAAAVAAFIYALLQCLSATRWWAIARAAQMALAWTDAVAAFYVGMFFNLFLPGLVGGDAVRALLVARKTNHSTAHAFGIVYADRTVGFIAMLLVGAWGAVALHLTHRQLVWQPLVWGAVFAVGVTAALVVSLSLLSRWSTHIWARRIGRFADGIVAFLVRPQTGGAVFAIALAYHLLLTATLMMLGKAAGIHGQPFAAYAMVVAIATVIGSLPVSLHGLGVRELASVQLWALLGIPAETAMLWALLWRVMVWLTALPGGLVYWLWADKTVWQDIHAVAQKLKVA